MSDERQQHSQATPRDESEASLQQRFFEVNSTYQVSNAGVSAASGAIPKDWNVGWECERRLFLSWEPTLAPSRIKTTCDVL